MQGAEHFAQGEVGAKWGEVVKMASDGANPVAAAVRAGVRARPPRQAPRQVPSDAESPVSASERLGRTPAALRGRIIWGRWNTTKARPNANGVSEELDEASADPGAATRTPQFFELFRPLLEVLADGREWKIPDAAQAVAEGLGLGEDARTLRLRSGRLLFENRVRWAVTSLSKAELAELVGRPRRAHEPELDDPARARDRLEHRHASRALPARRPTGPGGCSRRSGCPTAKVAGARA